MATIYRFIVETKERESRSSGRKSDGDSAGGKKRGAAKKGRYVSLVGSKGGVESNRKLRAINPVLNRITGGYWEKGMRIGRAGAGMVKINKEGALGISSVAIAIIVSMLLQGLMRYQNQLKVKAEKDNTNNFKALENGATQIHGAYTISTNIWSGAITYNQNK